MVTLEDGYATKYNMKSSESYDVNLGAMEKQQETYSFQFFFAEGQVKKMIGWV